MGLAGVAGVAGAGRQVDAMLVNIGQSLGRQSDWRPG